MKKKIVVLVLLAALLVFGCGKGDMVELGDRYPITLRASTPGLPYDDSQPLTSVWEGIGFNPEGPPGVESNTAPAFRDMSNLFGRMEELSARTRNESAPALQYRGGGSEIPSSSGVVDTTAANMSATEHKLIKRGNLRFRVENLETSDAFVTSQLIKYNGYSATTNIDETTHTYSLRVPSAYYDVFIAELGDLGRLINRSESTEDVTIRYYDLEGRLESRRELLRTYQSYLARARNIEEILSVEARIASLQLEIDSTGSQLRNLSNLIDYATITLTLFGPATTTVRKENTLGERITNLFTNFGGFLSSITVGIIGFIIYGIPLLILLVLLFWVFFGRIGLARKVWGFIRKQ